MAQLNYSYLMGVQSIYSKNVDLAVYSAFENIVLDSVQITAITNFFLTIKNNSGSGNVTVVNVYVAPNQTDFTLIESHLFTTIGPGTTQAHTFQAIAGFMRVTVETDANINIDVHLNGNLT